MKQFIVIISLILGLTIASGADTSKSAAAPKQKKPDPAFAPVTDDPKLPRVLLIGDSISVGYTLPVRALLQGKANVHRILENGGSTSRGLEKLQSWLGDGKWDVIHFNWGLHDLKYMDDKGKYVTPDQGKQVAPLPEYESNLRKLVARMKATGAKLIWATITPIPDGELQPGRKFGDEAEYKK